MVFTHPVVVSGGLTLAATILSAPSASAEPVYVGTALDVTVEQRVDVATITTTTAAELSLELEGDPFPVEILLPSGERGLVTVVVAETSSNSVGYRFRLYENTTAEGEPFTKANLVSPYAGRSTVTLRDKGDYLRISISADPYQFGQ